MSLDAHLIHTCTIQRATVTTDAYRNAVQTWSDLDTGVPCRLVEKRERVVTSDHAEGIVLTSYLLLVDSAVDVAERDQVIVDSATYIVTAVLSRNTRAPHHKSLALDLVN